MNKIRLLCFILPAAIFAGCGFFGEVEKHSFRQSSDNMLPTHKADDVFVCSVNRFINSDFKSGIKRGAIVVAAIPDEKIPENADVKPLPKRQPGPNENLPVIPGHSEFVYRIAGVGGDRVKISNGRVYVNGALFEKFPENPDKSSIKDFAEVLVPQGEYFLLGDNLGSKFDSRFWEKNTLDKDKIVCVVDYIFSGTEIFIVDS
jgi:signal peptidase I